MLVVFAFSCAVVTPTPPKATLAANPALSKSYRRAEFWDAGQATLFDIINVLGRWERADEWKTRTEFSEVENVREASPEQAKTLKRYEMAERLGMAQRVALQQNGPKLPFHNAALASSVGLSIDDFNDTELNPAAIDIIFDALAESRSGLIAPEVIDKRRARFLTEDGSFDQGVFAASLYKARFLVICSWFVLGKGNFIGLLVGLKILSDSFGTGDQILAALIERQDLVILALCTAAVMQSVGQNEAARGN